LYKIFLFTKHLVNINYRYFTFDLHNRYWKFKEKALDRTPLGTGFRRGNKPVVRQNAE